MVKSLTQLTCSELFFLTFINQVHASPQACMYFHKLFQQENLPPLQLLKWVCKCWTSLYDLIAHLLDMHLACNKFTLLTNDDNSVPNLKSLKTYQLFKLTECEWCMLELICDGLRELELSCQIFSHGTWPTVYHSFPVIESMQQRWESMAKAPKYAYIAPTLNASLNDLWKWYWTLDKSSIYFICLILDPHVKMANFQKHWEVKHFEVGKEALQKLTSHYLHCMLIH